MESYPYFLFHSVIFKLGGWSLISWSLMPTGGRPHISYCTYYRKKDWPFATLNKPDIS